ncbi:major facilitator superfamily domain-containing protein 10 [Strongylocentrotus purpuratus]|uniref:Major facilitator superfamily (MFS) profile domain-containing protein n=1 Tax=Strongylocentrotus purpuratus TaxID=7668 RepID=A0A7M7NTF6_STRPU|nr:major facilitator superfamily domain-containing protein 10 [Strongylocentrotus purpuratus]
MVSTRRTSYPEPAEVGDQPEGGSETKNSKTHGMVRIIFISLVLDLLAFTMILPLFPTLLDYYGRHDESGLYASLHHSVDQFREVLQIPDTKKYNSVLFGGVLGSLFSLLQFVTSPVIGAASDVYGRRSVMLVTMVGIALSYVLWAMSYNFGIFVLARIVGGIFKGNVSLSTTIVTDISTTKTRGKGMAMIGLAFSVGFIVGPMIGAYFATKGGLFAEGAWAVTPALLALTLSIADLLFVFAFLKETLPQEKRAPSMGNSFQERQNLINPFSLFRFSAVKNTNTKEMQILQQLGLSYFLYLFLFSGLEFTLTFLVHIRFQYTSMQQGKMFVFMGLIMAALQGGYVRRIKPGQEKRVALTGMLILIPAFVIIAFSSGSFLYYLGLALFSIASGTVVPCMTTIVTMYGPEDQKGTIMGIFRSLGALSRAFGPAAASAVYWGAGAGVCYIWGAVLMVFPIYILTRVIPAKTQ